MKSGTIIVLIALVVVLCFALFTRPVEREDYGSSGYKLTLKNTGAVSVTAVAWWTGGGNKSKGVYLQPGASATIRTPLYSNLFKYLAIVYGRDSNWEGEHDNSCPSKTWWPWTPSKMCTSDGDAYTVQLWACDGDGKCVDWNMATDVSVDIDTTYMNITGKGQQINYGNCGGHDPKYLGCKWNCKKC